MNVFDIISSKGPMLSSTLKNYLCSNGYSDQAARQVISRTGKNVRRLDGITFPKREKFFYLEKQYNTSEFFEAFLNALKETNSVHFDAICALGSWGGIVSIDKFKIISGSPEKRKKHKCISNLLSELLKARLVFKKENDGRAVVGLNSSIPREYYQKIDTRVLETLEEVMYLSLCNWLRANGLASYNQIKRKREFNSYYWDLTAPSYIFPLAISTKEKKQPGFIVADILPQFEIKKDHLRYFSKKFAATRSQYKNGNFLAILIGNKFTPEAFEYGKKSGFIITTPGNLFGEEVNALIFDLKNTLENISAAATQKNEEEIYKLINSVAKLEGKANNIRGQLFEMVSGYIISKINPGFIEIGKVVINEEGEKAEIDVFNSKGKSAIQIVECKGNNPNQIISKKTIEAWLEKIHIIRKWVNEISEYRSRKQYFEFWTTSEFDTGAVELLRKSKEGTKKYSIDWKDKKNLLEMVKKENLQSIYLVLKEHYIVE